ncbi:MAG: ATP-binding cassette domain-containing protein [Thomasclavelia sp.]
MASAPLKQSQKGFQGKNYDIVFDDVCFAYEKDEVLHDINIKIKQGRTVALIGESGSGKSTLAKLLVHFYDPTKGTIKIGRKISKI